MFNTIKQVMVPGFLFLHLGVAMCGAAVLLDDNFDDLRPGMFSAGVIGAHAEYHYLHEPHRRATGLSPALPGDYPSSGPGVSRVKTATLR